MDGGKTPLDLDRAFRIQARTCEDVDAPFQSALIGAMAAQCEARTPGSVGADAIPAPAPSS